MKPKKADVMLHPVRIRIIQSLLTNERMTVAQLLADLDDIPQATMYRQLKQLYDADIVEVAEQHKVRGAIEKVYTLKKDNLTISDHEVNESSQDDHIRYFLTYQANLLKEFEKYAKNHEPSHYKEDGLGYWQTTLHLTKEELNQFGEELKSIMEKYASKQPKNDRMAHTIATTFIPKKREEADDDAR